MTAEGTLDPEVTTWSATAAAHQANAGAAAAHPTGPLATNSPQLLPSSWVPLYNMPLRTPTKKLRIVTIGAGVSGIGFAHMLQHVHRLTEGGAAGAVVEHTIYESNRDVGGTWLVNTYPGVACDAPAHAYSFPFEVSAY